MIRIRPHFPSISLRNFLNPTIIILSLPQILNFNYTFSSLHTLTNTNQQKNIKNLVSVYDELVRFNNLINQHPLPPLQHFTKLLTNLTKLHHYPTVISLIKRLNLLNIKHDIYITNIEINCFCQMGHVGFALSVLAKCFKCGLGPDIVTFNTLIKGMCRNDMVDYARNVFDKMPEKNDVTYGVLVNRLCKMGDVNDAVMLLRDISQPSVVVYSTIIDSLCKTGKMKQALGLYIEMTEKGVVPNDVTG